MSQPRGLDPARLRALLRGEPFVKDLLVRDTVGSTNELLRELAAEGAPAGTVVLADAQTAGRGRLGRSWHSPPGLGLFVSILLRPTGPVEALTRWTLAAAVAACAACRTATSEAAVCISWPNDIIWQGRKVGGVLAELRSSAQATSELVLGTGLNVSHTLDDFPFELRSSAASLRLAAGDRVPSREILAALYLRELADVARLIEAGNWADVARRWEAMAPDAVGRPVRVLSHARGAPDYDGVSSGLDELGGLRVRRGDGTTVSARLAQSVRLRED